MTANELSAKDLMIGDWVSVIIEGETYQGRVSRIDGDTENICVSLYNAPYGWEDGDAFDGISPIPLTAEILEKNGFVANKHVYPYPYYEYKVKEIKFEVGFGFPQGNETIYKDPWIYVDSEHVFIEHLPCVFVHELQHVLRLCKIEKTIEL